MSSLGTHSNFYDEWQANAKALQNRMETWMKATNAARDEAERARSRAEADRNAAQEARDQALKQLVSESGGRIAAQERLHEVEKERDEARSEYISMQREMSRMKKDVEEAKQALLGEREALQISEVERKATRKDLDNAMKELVQVRRENERLSNSVANVSKQLEETKVCVGVGLMVTVYWEAYGSAKMRICGCGWHYGWHYGWHRRASLSCCLVLTCFLHCPRVRKATYCRFVCCPSVC